MLRPSSVERGYDEDWRRVRALHLAHHPDCAAPHCDSPATEVDHVEGIAQRPDRRLDPTNLRSLCKHHHSQRTARDQGFARPGQANAPAQRGMVHPPWITRAIVPAWLVAGPPGSGKSTYVEQRAASRDLVLDIDAIVAKLSGGPLYTGTREAYEQALRWRNSRLALIGHVHRWPQAWVIAREPKAQWRQWWVDQLGARIVVLETDIATCQVRILADARRDEASRKAACLGALSWWALYERRGNDMVLRPNERPTTARALGALDGGPRGGGSSTAAPGETPC